MIGGIPGDAKLPVLEPLSALPKALPPPKLPPPKPPLLLPKPPPPKPPPPKAEGAVPLTVANGDGAEASLLPKLRVGLGMLGGVTDLLGDDEPSDANGDAEPVAPPPKTLLPVPAEANGDAEAEASLEKPEAANAAVEVEVCGGGPSFFDVSVVDGSTGAGA